MGECLHISAMPALFHELILPRATSLGILSECSMLIVMPSGVMLTAVMLNVLVRFTNEALSPSK
jgi:hypothetical protein